MALHLFPASFRASLSMIEEAGISYALGPLDESVLGMREIQPEEGAAFLLLVPVRLPGSLYEALAFENGAAIGYRYGDEMGETPIQVVNRVYRDFFDELRRGGTYPWIVGYLLGCFTACVEQDRQLALVGMAHVCFLVSRLPDCTSAAFHRALSQIETFHNAVVRAYRAQVRTLREQGMSSAEAWQSALRPQWQAV